MRQHEDPDDAEVAMRLMKLPEGRGVQKPRLKDELGELLNARWHIGNSDPEERVRQIATCQLDHLIATAPLEVSKRGGVEENTRKAHNQLRVAFNIASEAPAAVRASDLKARLEWFGSPDNDALRPYQSLNTFYTQRKIYKHFEMLARASRTHSLSPDELARQLQERFDVAPAIVEVSPTARPVTTEVVPDQQIQNRAPSVKPSKTRKRRALAIGPIAIPMLPTAAIVLVGVVIGAGYIGNMASRADKNRPRETLKVAGPTPGQTATVEVSHVPVSAAQLAVTVDMNPNHLGSKELTQFYWGDEDWMVPKGKTVVGKPGDGSDPGSFYRFVKSYNAIPVNDLYFNVSVQNLTGGAVLLRNMRLANLNCGKPPKGTRISKGGGADYNPPRAILIDLDSKSPKPLYVSKVPATLKNPPPNTILPFGFSLSAEQTESFDVAVLSEKHSCEFELVIDAVVNGQATEISINDSTKPFKVAGMLGGPVWRIVNVNGWAYDPGDGSVFDQDKIHPWNEPLPETNP